MRRPETAGLFLPLQRELVALLRGLADEDWSRPTLARGWAVGDVAAHLLDTDLRRLSAQRDAHRPSAAVPGGYEEVVAFINRLNAAWVETARRLSPRVLTDLLEWTGPQVAQLFASLAPDEEAAVPVAWAGEARSANWMDVGREYTEKWHHQAQIRDAVGAPRLDSRRWLGPVIELSVYALPHAFRGCEAGPGAALSVHVEGDAGGLWHILRARATAGNCARAKPTTRPPACVWTPTRPGVSSSTRCRTTRPPRASKRRATRVCAGPSSPSAR
jgi:uncharacterized protein (TIGR03083 family)